MNSYSFFIHRMNSYTHTMIWIHILLYKLIYSSQSPPHQQSHTWNRLLVILLLWQCITTSFPTIWEKNFNPHGRVFYIDHNTKSMTLERPLPPIEDHCKQNDATDNCIIASVNNLLHLTSDFNSWTSKFVITHGDQSIDVSSAAQGALSPSPSGIYPHQNIPYPSTKYCFDDKFFLELMLRIYW